jgi:uncharacterized iron-regulated protein
VEGVAFRVYDGEGRSRSFADILAALDSAETLLVGEEHDDVVGHQVEAEILVRATQRVGPLSDRTNTRTVILSLEMFEWDVQSILDEYLADLITEDQFKSSARPWPKYDSDYRPMVEFARAHGLPVIAANAPRRYVNRVSRLGPEALSDLPESARAFLPPLPYPRPSEEYTAQWDALMAEMMADMAAEEDSAAARHPEEEGPEEDDGDPETSLPPTHDMGNALHAQALWDAAMGRAVSEALGVHLGALVIHYAGSFHVEKGTGILERIRDYRPGARVVTVVMEPVEDIDAWDEESYRGLGDFVVLTHRPPSEEESEGS